MTGRNIGLEILDGSLMGVSVRTVQDWEQDRREPSGPAKSPLRIAEQHPEVFLEIA